MKFRNGIIKCILLIGCISFYVHTEAQNWDIDLLKKINPQNPNSGTMKVLTNSSYPIAVATPISLLAAGYIQKDKRLQHKGWEAAGSLLIAAVITEGLKYTVNRDRPYEKYPGEVFPNSIETDPSFPSGHASLAFSTATTLTLEFKKWYIAVPSYAWAAGVSYSRMYLGQHYPTDIIGSAIVGSGSAILSHWLSKKVFK
ncbi:MAG TPA: phosphatase PAP2 family protein [Chitinophagaceae bacterium]|jgi:undecaprenyl-diphosphatase